MIITDAHYLYLDFQTTGASPEYGSVLELAWRHSSEENTRSFLIRQEEPIPRRIRSLTGIQNEELEKEGHAEEKVFFELLEQLKLRPVDALVLHFARFELQFLKALFAKYSAEFSLPPVLCTFEITKRLYPRLPARSLRAVAGFFGEPICELKRATEHVNATARIWKGLSEELGRKEILTLDGLQEWLRDPAVKKPQRGKGYDYLVDRNIRLQLPDKPGIYRMLSKTGSVLYVGKATSLRDRVNSYFRGRKGKETRKLEMLAQVYDVSFEECETAIEAALLESDEIKRLDPPYNVSLKEKRRKLNFYSRDFEICSEVQCKETPVGPFGNGATVAIFQKVVRTLQKDECDPALLYEPVDPFVLAEGVNLFLEQTELDRISITNRTVLAWALRVVKAELAKEAFDEESFVTDEDLDGDDDVGEEEKELTPEDVSFRLERLILNFALNYLRTKDLTKLLNSQVEWRDWKSRKKHVLNFSKGKLSKEQPSVPAEFPWQDLDLHDYDRMVVLTAEIKRQRDIGSLAIRLPGGS